MDEVLLLLLGDVPPEQLHAWIGDTFSGTPRVRVVAPAVVGAVDWLATDEGRAYRQAQVRVLEAEWTLADEVDVVDGDAGESDPLQAVSDVMRTFHPDVIAVAGGAFDRELDDALTQLGPPVVWLGAADVPQPSRAYRALRRLAAGRDPSTPFVLFVGVNAALLLLSLFLSALVIATLWLTGSL